MVGIPPELSPNDRVQFLDYHRPLLRAGDYTLTIEQKVEDIDETIIDETIIGNFSVQGERYTLPPQLIHAVYPPTGADGQWYRTLPHLALERGTLPWERSPSNATVEDALSPSWVALLLFVKDEIPAPQTPKNPNPKCQLTLLRAGDLKDVLPNPSWPGMQLEVADDATQPVTVIDVPWTILQKQLPTYDDLYLNAHSRHVVLDGQAGPATELAVVIGNRLPPNEYTKCAAHLVSLERRFVTSGSGGSGEDASLDELGDSLPKLIRPAWDKLGPLVQALTSQQPKLPVANNLPQWQQWRREQRQLQTLTVELHIPSGGHPTLLVPSLPKADSPPLTVEQVNAFLRTNPGSQLTSWLAIIKDVGRISITVTNTLILNQDGRREHRPVVVVDIEHMDVASNVDTILSQYLGHCLEGDYELLVLNPGQVPRKQSKRGSADPTAGERIPNASALSPEEIKGMVKSCFPTNSDATNSDTVLINLKEQVLVEITWQPNGPALFRLRPTLADKVLLEVLKKNEKNEIARRVQIEAGLLPWYFTAQTLDQTFSMEEVQKLCEDALPDDMRARFLQNWQVHFTRWLRGPDTTVNSISLTLDCTSPKPTPPDSLDVRLTMRPAERMVFDPQAADPTMLVRLISLYHWEFTCEPSAPDFGERIKQLIKADESAVFRASTEGSLSADDRTPEAVAQVYTAAGYSMMQHHFRNGTRGLSWYRGPFVPQVSVDASASNWLVLPARAADELLLFDADYGVFDASYAAAWELGRLMALADTKFAYALLEWKRTQRQHITRQIQRLDHMYLPLLYHLPADLDLPDDLANWLLALTRLEGVPFSYFVPNQELLPQESLRFFDVDPAWIEALRDGALSIGRVLGVDHAVDHAQTELLATSPRISGFLLRSAIVSDYPTLGVRAYVASTEDSSWKSNSHLEGLEQYHRLPLLQMLRFAPNVLVCLFYDDSSDQNHTLNLLEFFIPPQVLHFGVEEEGEGLVKVLRNPDDGQQLCFTISGQSCSIDDNDISSATLTWEALNHLLESSSQIDAAVLRKVVENLTPGGLSTPLTWHGPETNQDEAFNEWLNHYLYGEAGAPDQDARLNIDKIGQAFVTQGNQRTLSYEALATLAGQAIPDVLLLQLQFGMIQAPLQFIPQPDPSMKDLAQQKTSVKDLAQQKFKSAGGGDDKFSVFWNALEKQVVERVSISQALWRTPTDTDRVLNLSALFQRVASRLKPIVKERAVGAGDFALQMLDAPSLVRFWRQGIN